MPTCVDCNGYYDSISAAEVHVCVPSPSVTNNHLLNPKEALSAFMRPKKRSHYHFLDDHFDTILERMGRSDYISRRGNFSASGDKYYQYRQNWDDAGVPFFHGAAMYHLMELFYAHEVRETADGWVDPWRWVCRNYREGHQLGQHMVDLS